MTDVTRRPHRFYLFAPPYRVPEVVRDPLEIVPRDSGAPAGECLVWCLGTRMDDGLLHAARRRPPGLQLLAVLPRSDEITDPDELLRMVELSRPHAVLPFHHEPDPIDLRTLLREPPHDLAQSVVDYLGWRGLVLDPDMRQLIRRTVELSMELTTVSSLARGVYMSRRALGRAFLREGLPVPSHWLHIGRVLRAAIELQWNGETLMRTASRNGYPDGFSLSNQMKRLTGIRPSDVKRRIGWEWVFEAWIRQEVAHGGFGADQIEMLARRFAVSGEGVASA